jgi:pectate lyase
VGLRAPAPPASAALALAFALATGAAACHDVGLYPLRARPPDAGADAVTDTPTITDTPTVTDTPTITDAPTVTDTPTVVACQNLNGPVIGFAALTSKSDAGVSQVGTTGGSGPTIPVSNLDDLMFYAGDTAPHIIQINGMLTFPPIPDGGTSNTPVKVASNKTIVGMGADSGLVGGGLDLTYSTNVIVRNLKILKAYGGDAIHLQYSRNVWVDHCDLSCDTDIALRGTCDDLVSVTHATDYVTVSWTVYHDHHDTGIIGHSDSTLAEMEDPGHLTVTYHHDLFTRVDGGPRARWGTVNHFNVDFEHVTDYAVASTTYADVYVESSVFNDVAKPLTTTLSTSPDGYITEGTGDRANEYVAPTTSGQNVRANMIIVPPPQYPYGPVDAVQSVPTIVQTCAGTGKIDPLPIPMP